MTPGRTAPPPSGPWLSVWPTGQADVPDQLDVGGYLPATAEDTAAVPPAVAAHAIAAYSRPGRAVYDPDCGAGTVLVEALRAGRHAAGFTADPGWWELARGNVSAAKADGATGDGMVLDDPLATVPAVGRAGRVDLALTALRPPGPGQVRPGWLRDTLSAYRTLPRPGGRLVIVTSPHPGGGPAHLGGDPLPGRMPGEDPDGGWPLDLASAVATTGRAVGLIPVERCAALTAALADDAVHLHTSPASHPVAWPAAAGHAGILAAHLDVVVFRRAAAGSPALRLAPPTVTALPTPVPPRLRRNRRAGHPRLSPTPARTRTTLPTRRAPAPPTTSGAAMPAPQATPTPRHAADAGSHGTTGGLPPEQSPDLDPGAAGHGGRNARPGQAA